jgi:hypothetical protein
MKRIITLALSAMLICLSAEAQKNIYHIDGKPVENFDGSQLIGKTIKHYDLKVLPEVQTTIHNIFTTDDWTKIEGARVITTTRVLTEDEAKAQGIPFASGSVRDLMRNPLIILDGKEFTGSMNDISPDNIKSVDVYKPESDVAKSYGDKGRNGVVKIFTTTQADAVTYFINGQPASKADFNRLTPESIKEIKVLKRGTAAAIKASREGGTHDVYLVTTK